MLYWPTYGLEVHSQVRGPLGPIKFGSGGVVYWPTYGLDVASQVRGPLGPIRGSGGVVPMNVLACRGAVLAHVWPGCAFPGTWPAWPAQMRERGSRVSAVADNAFGLHIDLH